MRKPGPRTLKREKGNMGLVVKNLNKRKHCNSLDTGLDFANKFTPSLFNKANHRANQKKYLWERAESFKIISLGFL